MSDVLTLQTDDPFEVRKRLVLATLTASALVYLWYAGVNDELTGLARAAAPWVFLTLYVMSILTAILSFLNAWFPERFLYAPWGAYRTPFAKARGVRAKRISLTALVTSQMENLGVRDALRVCYEVCSTITNFVFLPLAYVLPGGWVARRGDQDTKIVMVRDADGSIVEYSSTVGLPRRFQDPAKPRSIAAARRAERVAQKPVARPHDVHAIEHRFGRGAQVVDFTFAIGSLMVCSAWMMLR